MVGNRNFLFDDGRLTGLLNAHNIVNTKKRSRLFAILKQRGLPAKEFADSIGITVRTLHNVACGNSKSLLSRQKIVNALQVDQLWPGVFVTERVFTLPPGTEIEYPSVKAARDGVDELPPGSVNRSGRTLLFIQPVTVAIDISPAKSQRAKNRKMSASSVE